MQAIELAKHFIEAVERGDVATARACFADDAEIWHNFDNKIQSPDENMATLEWMIGKADTREYRLQRLEEIPGGYLQQHILHIVDKAGRVLEMFACAVVSVKDGKITRIEEYIDPTPLSVWMGEQQASAS